MRSNKKWLNDAKLYLILDTQVNGYTTLLEILKKAVNSGVDIVQLRDKTGSAKNILDFSSKALRIINRKIPFIINDRVDLAIIAKASGVHLGQEDIPLKTARQMMGAKAIIGVSCQTLEHARQAEREGADYIGFGSVFKTQTKPERVAMDLNILSRVVKEIKIPVFAIGGITGKNIGWLRNLDVRRVAVCRDICQARDVTKAVKQLRLSLEWHGL